MYAIIRLAMESFKTHAKRLSKMTSVIERFNALGKIPDCFDIPDELIDSLSVSELVDYVIFNYPCRKI